LSLENGNAVEPEATSTEGASPEGTTPADGVTAGRAQVGFYTSREDSAQVYSGLTLYCPGYVVTKSEGRASSSEGRPSSNKSGPKGWVRFSDPAQTTKGLANGGHFEIVSGEDGYRRVGPDLGGDGRGIELMLEEGVYRVFYVPAGSTEPLSEPTATFEVKREE
jgi:hypothetical protein